MHYQVVARTSDPAGTWDYYPYWAPVRDKDAATRLANYAAQDGYEAAILQSVTVEMLHNIARGVVDQQDAQLLPALRYLPGAPVATALGHRAHSVQTGFHAADGLDPYTDGPVKAALDERRLMIEMGLGGDVTMQSDWRHRIDFPCRMELLGAWVSLRQRLLHGHVGGSLDGASADERIEA